jgi:hypothetical protein
MDIIAYAVRSVKIDSLMHLADALIAVAAVAAGHEGRPPVGTAIQSLARWALAQIDARWLFLGIHEVSVHLKGLNLSTA